MGDGGSSFIMLGLIVLIFYFFMIRPQMKKQKEQKKFREALKNGDKVVTIGGIHGKISSVEDTSITLEIATGVKIKMSRSSITEVKQ